MPSLKIENGVKGIYQLNFFGRDVLAVFSGREFGMSNRDDYLKELNVSPESLILLKQVHSANLILVKSHQKPTPDCQADGMLTTTPGIALGILTADCVPVFFWDEERRAAGIAHAGWRGVYQGIIPKMIQAFRFNFKTKVESLRIALGPSIKKCCYEVGEEFAELFPDHYILPEDSGATQGHMDLTAAIFDQLKEEGVNPSEQVFDSEICTVCQNDSFFSARHEKGTPERILSVIQFHQNPV